MPLPRPIWLSPSHPPLWRKAPKAVDEDPYKISLEVLRAKHRRVRMTGLCEPIHHQVSMWENTFNGDFSPNTGMSAIVLVDASVGNKSRRTQISERMRKLQELVPNMDKGDGAQSAEEK
ncbi:unnamed protein product [Camellia sinensis]